MSSPTDRSIRRAASRLRVGVFVCAVIPVTWWRWWVVEQAIRESRRDHELDELNP